MPVTRVDLVLDVHPVTDAGGKLLLAPPLGAPTAARMLRAVSVEHVEMMNASIDETNDLFEDNALVKNAVPLLDRAVSAALDELAAQKRAPRRAATAGRGGATEIPRFPRRDSCQSCDAARCAVA